MSEKLVSPCHPKAHTWKWTWDHGYENCSNCGLSSREAYRYWNGCDHAYGWGWCQGSPLKGTNHCWSHTDPISREQRRNEHLAREHQDRMGRYQRLKGIAENSKRTHRAVDLLLDAVEELLARPEPFEWSKPLTRSDLESLTDQISFEYNISPTEASDIVRPLIGLVMPWNLDGW